MKSRLLTIILTIILTIAGLLMIGHFMFGLFSEPLKIMNVDSPDGLFNAYVIEEPSLDPPNQSLYISKNVLNEFRYVAHLPEDIEAVSKIFWMPDSKTVVFATNWHLIITRIDSFNTKKVSINDEWWKWHQNKKTYSSSQQHVIIEQFEIISSDTLLYKTNLMSFPKRIGVRDI